MKAQKTKTAYHTTSLTAAVLLAVLAAIIPSVAYTQETDISDVESIDAIITAAYDMISGDAGEPRDWDRWSTLFVDEARLSPTRPTPDGRWGRSIISAQDYPTRTGTNHERNGFVEAEIGRVTEQYGHIAHVFSTYVSFRSREDTEPFQPIIYIGTIGDS